MFLFEERDIKMFVEQSQSLPCEHVGWSLSWYIKTFFVSVVIMLNNNENLNKDIDSAYSLKDNVRKTVSTMERFQR